ncbi:alginate lyase family protein [Lentibacter algarum]|uniref:alginate lyase family protein n=1 Tax=Lentibacter algarum TaxID=576131 RepID=UPI001C07244B|nr:alginate lyase family protein [Lentibacter algarum]MBU2981402.1 alginate lyase family protein [Lentibacter algarum]
MRRKSRNSLLALSVCLPGAALADCTAAPEPLVSLSFESRYADDDPSRSILDEDAEEEAKEALKTLDTFINDLSTRTDAALESNDSEAAVCVMQALATWAEADALSNLKTETVQLTIASRIAALALVAAQVSPSAQPAHTATVTAWLTRRTEEQMTFWETAPEGAASGNLRAWAALAVASTALLNNDHVMRGWAAWSLSYVACTANEDGSLPQEMSRKHLALHYQLHAVTPLTVTATLLEQQGVSVMNRCERALDRIVAFTVRDLTAGGAESEAITGEEQSLNQGAGDLKDFQLAWAESWLTLRANPELEAIVAPRRPLRYSKLGGDQTRLWRGVVTEK